jgi:hypothetical protein
MLLDHIDVVERWGRGDGQHVSSFDPAVGKEWATRKIPALSRTRQCSDAAEVIGIPLGDLQHPADPPAGRGVELELGKVSRTVGIYRLNARPRPSKTGMAPGIV